jgi:hypothetical protein
VGTAWSLFLPAFDCLDGLVWSIFGRLALCLRKLA